jgi:hypothetical protein
VTNLMAMMLKQFQAVTKGCTPQSKLDERVPIGWFLSVLSFLSFLSTVHLPVCDIRQRVKRTWRGLSWASRVLPGDGGEEHFDLCCVQCILLYESAERVKVTRKYNHRRQRRTKPV